MSKRGRADKGEEEATSSTKDNLKTIIENKGTPFKKGKYDSKFIVPRYSEEKGRLGKIELPYFIKPLYQGNVGVEDFGKELTMVQGVTLKNYPHERLTRIHSKLKKTETDIENFFAWNKVPLVNNVSGFMEELMRKHDNILELTRHNNASVYPEALASVVKYWEFHQLRISHYVYDKVLAQLRESVLCELHQPVAVADTTVIDLEEEELQLKLALIQNKKKKTVHTTETKNQKRHEIALTLVPTAQSALPPIASTLVAPPTRSSVVIEEIDDIEDIIQPRVTRSQANLTNGSMMMALEDGDEDDDL